jgi:hypothetical protein
VVAKSIIEVEVDDAAFKRFVELYGSYRETLKEMPGEWGKVTEAASGTAEHFQEMTSALLAQNEVLREQDREIARKNRVEDGERRKREDERRVELKAEQAKSKFWRDRVASLKDAATYTAKAAGTLLKWGGIAGAGLVGGGLFGIDRLADVVSDARKSSLGLGTTTGQQRAARVAFGRFVDNPDASLGAVAEAQSDRNRWWAFNSLGVNKNQDPTKAFSDLLSKAKELWGKSDKSEQYAHAVGLDQFFSLTDLRRLDAMTPAELEQRKKVFEASQKQLAIEDELQKKWQDLSDQLHKAGLQIETAFVKGLQPIINQLPKLSDEIASVTEKFLGSAAVQDWMGSFGDRLKELTSYLGSDKFQSDLKGFFDGLELVSKEIFSVATRLKWLLLPDEPTPKGDAEGTTMGSKDKWGSNRNLGGSAHPSPTNPLNLRVPGSDTMFQQFQNPAVGFYAAGQQLQRYETEKKWGHADTLAKIIALWAPHLDKRGKVINDTAAYVKDVSKQTGFDPNQHLDLSDRKTLATLMAAMSHHENRNNRYTAAGVLNMMQSTETQNAWRDYVGRVSDVNEGAAEATAGVIRRESPKTILKREVHQYLGAHDTVSKGGVTAAELAAFMSGGRAPTTSTGPAQGSAGRAAPSRVEITINNSTGASVSTQIRGVAN